MEGAEPPAPVERGAGGVPGAVSPAPVARRGGTGDVPLAAATLAAAFADEPYVRWGVPEDRFAERLRGVYALFGELTVAHGELWLAAGGASVAMWQPPGSGLPDDPAVQSRLEALLGDRFERFLAGQEQSLARQPVREHWYLPLLGTLPGRRCAGLARAVLAPVLARADAGATLVVTDTSTEANLAFYARLGFAVRAEWDEPAGGPRVWLLEREPTAPPGAPA